MTTLTTTADDTREIAPSNDDLLAVLGLYVPTMYICSMQPCVPGTISPIVCG